MSLPPIGGLDTRGVLALRSAILERNAALTARLNPPEALPQGGGFQAAITDALAGTSAAQARAGEVSGAYERGDTVDIAGVMLARQKASISFEATLQVRNKLLSAYKDIMSMPV
ncbi:MAG: flagellar hook-basal body complex protein FliE [Polymorphobacter sp.]